MAEASILSAPPEPMALAARLASALAGSQPPSNHSELMGSTLVAEVTSILQSNSAELKLRILEMLADASRQVHLRDVMGKNGLVTACCRSFHIQEPEVILKQRLRFIGNSCADNNCNRDIIIRENFYNNLAKLIADPNQSSLYPTAAAVLFNFMNDYSPAQRHAQEHGLIGILTISFSKTTEPSYSMIEYSLKCLELVLQLELDTIPEGLIAPLLNIATSSCISLDILQPALSCLVILLKGESTELYILRSTLVTKCLVLMTRLRNWEDTMSNDSTSEMDDEDRQEALSIIRNCRSVLVSTISNISALEAFPEQYPMETNLMKLVMQWLGSEDLDLVTCAALILGNVARDTETCETLVKHGVHSMLIEVLRERTQVAALHAAGGALKNLVIGCPGLREQMVVEGVLDHCHKFYLTTAMIEMQHMGLSLVRLLIANSLRNIECLVSPRHSGFGPTPMSQALDLYDKNTELPVRVEVGRIVASVLRETARCPATYAGRGDLEKHIVGLCPRFIQPVVHMVVQDKWPVLASEGWFAMALFVRTGIGANTIGEMPLPRPFYMALKRVITSDKLPNTDEVGQAAGSSTCNLTHDTEKSQRDRENAYIFLAEFLKNCVSFGGEAKRQLFQQFVNGEEVNVVDLDSDLCP